MSQPSFRTYVLALSALGLACANLPTEPIGRRLPVIQGLLIADSTEHVFTITWSADRIDSPGPFEAEPVDPSEVALTLHLPGGASAEVDPVAGSPGRFAVRASVRPLEIFRLTGTVAGFPVEASTQVPGPLVIILPERDTTRVPSGDPLALRTVTFIWAAALAAGYYPWRPAEVAFPSDLTSGEIVFYSTATDTVAFTILAVDSASAAFYGAGFYDVPVGNIPGILGVFGAASSARRVFIWE